LKVKQGAVLMPDKELSPTHQLLLALIVARNFIQYLSSAVQEAMLQHPLTHRTVLGRPCPSSEGIEPVTSFKFAPVLRLTQNVCPRWISHTGTRTSGHASERACGGRIVAALKRTCGATAALHVNIRTAIIFRPFYVGHLREVEEASAEETEQRERDSLPFCSSASFETIRI
jgi:hypothetical protein